MNIPELGKPQGKPCFFICAEGCSAYNVRPSFCQSFKCEWLKGRFEEEDRPDKSGVVLTLSERSSELGKRSLLAYGVGYGWLSKASVLLEKISKKEIVILNIGSNRKAIGPRDEIDRVNRIIEKHRRQ